MITIDSFQFRLHPSQQTILFDQMLNSASPCYNVGGYLRLLGPLQKDKFIQAVELGPDVFDAFRMRFDFNLTDQLCGYCDTSFSRFKLRELDLSRESDPHLVATRWAQDRFNVPFELDQNALLFEHALIKLSENEHWYFNRFHHLIFDGFSFRIWVRYICDHYNSVSKANKSINHAPSYIREAISAAAYDQNTYEINANYWAGRIGNLPSPVLFSRYPIFNENGKKSGKFNLVLNETQRSVITLLQATSKVTLQQLTIAALLIYFGKTKEQNEFVFAVPVHKRGGRKHVRDVVGVFSAIVPFKGTFEEKITLIQFLANIKRLQARDYRHQDFFFRDLLRQTKTEADGRSIFEIAINYQVFDFGADFGNDLFTSVTPLSSEFEEVPLQVCWRDFGVDQPLEASFLFQYRYFTHDEIRLFASRILFILTQFYTSLNRLVGDIKILPDDERRLIISDFVKTRSEVSTLRQHVVQIFQKTVESRPNSTALVFNDTEVSYAKLNEKSNVLARYLQSIGVKPGIFVGVCLQPSIDLITTLIAIMKVGGVIVPIDPTFPTDRIAYVLDDTQCTVVITEGAVCPVFTRADIVVVNIGQRSMLTRFSNRNLKRYFKDNELTYTIYTSGSTGRPKGVMVKQESLLNVILFFSLTLRFTKSSSIVSFTNFCFDIFYLEVFLPLLTGGKLVLLTKEEALNPLRILESLSKHQPTHIQATPSIWRLLFRSGWKNPEKAMMLVGGEPMSDDLRGYLLSIGEVWNLYGPTETCIYSTNKLVRATEGSSIGKPISNTSVYILDKHRQICPIGEEGEIYIGGIGVAHGYLNQPKLTAEKFVENEFENGEETLYKTGDVGRWLTNGEVEFLGRVDDQVKIRGHRIEVGEVESVLMESGLVDQAVVLPMEGNDHERTLVGYVVPNKYFDSLRLKSYLKTRLPSYMLPKRFVTVDGIPMTSNGKLDRAALMKIGVTESLPVDSTRPRTAIENALANVWRRLLEVDDIDVNDSFFDRGGDSLTAMKLILYLNQEFSINMTVRTLFQFATIAEQSKYIELSRLRKMVDEKTDLSAHEL